MIGFGNRTDTIGPIVVGCVTGVSEKVVMIQPRGKKRSVGGKG